jgi:mannitol/fructose-specific phosphotransferase system IIA component (Ntr-type)
LGLDRRLPGAVLPARLSILAALQEGRLIELPDTDKDKSLQHLASLIEAVPDFAGGFDFAGAVLARERAANTAIGAGWSCPHGRVSGEEELLCALGWSPAGIEWASPDGRPVHLVCMHYIPDSEKNTYLKEISSLARAIQGDARMREFGAEKDLGGVRHRMLDLLTAAVEAAIPQAKARMIRLEAKQAAAAGIAPDLLSSVQLVPLSVVVAAGIRPVVLCQDGEPSAGIEAAPDLSSRLAAKAPFDQAGYRILIHSVRPFQPDRFLYDCLAIRLGGPLPGK